MIYETNKRLKEKTLDGGRSFLGLSSRFPRIVFTLPHSLSLPQSVEREEDLFRVLIEEEEDGVPNATPRDSRNAERRAQASVRSRRSCSQKHRCL